MSGGVRFGLFPTAIAAHARDMRTAPVLMQPSVPRSDSARTLLRVAAGFAAIVGLGGCFVMRPSSGGGQTSFRAPRNVDVSDIALPPGYRIEPVAVGLNMPTGVAFDGSGAAYVTESGYCYGEVWSTPRLLRIGPRWKQKCRRDWRTKRAVERRGLRKRQFFCGRGRSARRRAHPANLARRRQERARERAAEPRRPSHQWAGGGSGWIDLFRPRRRDELRGGRPGQCQIRLAKTLSAVPRHPRA